MMYKYLQPLINILIYSQEENQHEAYTLARSAMISTGAFNHNLSEIDVWFLFLPGHKKDKYFAETEGGKMYGDFSAVVSFLCDAVSTMGNNLYKNLYHMHCLISQLGSLGENSFNFSPLVVIIIQKCLRQLESDSGNFNLPDKTMISLYVSNTLSLLLQSQAELGSLPGLINLLLSEKFNGPFSVSEDSNGTLCEWRPLKKLLLFAQSIVNQQTCDSLFCMPARVVKGNGGSLYKVLSKVKEFLENKLDTGLVGVAISLSSSIICASPSDIIDCFPLLVFVAQRLFEAQTQCLLLVLSLEWNILPVVSDLWPDLFFSALDIVGGMLSNSHEHNDGHFLSKKEANSTASLRPVSTNHRDSSESTVTAFRFFLERASFYSIFTSIFSLSSFNVSLSTKLLDLLLAKVSAGGLRDSILSLRVVLFWAHQIRSSYKVKPSDDLERLLQMCFVLIEHILEHLLAAKNGTAILERVGTHCQVDCVLEVAELIILHPLVNQSLSNPFCSDSLVKEILYDDLGDIIVLSKRSLHPIDHSILRIFNRVADFLIAFRGIWKATPTTSVSASVVEAFKKISQYCLDSFREKFSLSITSKDLVPLLPSFCILHGLMHFISPSDLLALVHWMLSRVDHHVIGLKSQGVHVLSVALCIADGAFKVLSGVLHQRNRGCLLFWESTGRTYSTCLLQNVFFKILDFSARFSLDLADRCLLSAVDTVYGLRFSRPTAAVLPFNMLMLKIIISSPVEILTHCIYNISKTKARLLFNLTEISSLHSRLFGMIFYDIICKEPSSNLGDKLSLKGAVAMNKCNYAFANEDFVLLLPAALSFLTNNILKFRGCNHETCLNIPAFYSRILLDSFSNWKEYVSMDIFHEDCDELTSKQENFHSAFHSTLLGKAVRMLQYFFTLSQDSVKRKQQLKYFDSIYESNELLSTVDVLKTKAQSYGETFNFVNKVIAKISFTWLLLFYQENQFHDFSMEVDGDSKVASIRKESKREKCAKLKFMDILVSALHKIVKNTSSKLDPHEESNSACWFQLLRFLEVSIINSILRLATKINSFVTLSTSTPFLESFIKSSLSHRFDDPFTLKAIQNILTTFKGGLPTGEVLELVLGHSKFVSIILSGDSFHTSYSLAQTGTFLQTAPSIFELVASPSIQRPLDFKHALFDLRNRESCPDNIKLELVKLLRFLYHHVVPQNEMGVDSMNSRELLSLLLSGYGASLHETDLEIFQLLLEIESIEKSSTSSIADMDYLWGCSALKIRKEQTIDRLVNDNQATDCETVQDKSRRLFRENILINSKTCALTVLNFCYERSKLMSCKYLEGPSQYDILDVPHADNSQQSRLANLYDPSFILRFSINSLLKGYIGPIEFTRLGLLAIALVSISSLDADVRTLGYEALGSFQKALMDHKKNKDVLQLQLLLTYLQNGITEPWQRIPSICAIFAAEASFILLDTSHDHFQTISKFLMRSPKMGLKDIPLFHAFFDSSSIKFETEHLWILRLIYAGLNIDDDAQILMSKFVIEILLSFYDSSLSNTETKVVILQILKKSVKLHMLACRLVMSSGLLSWLYSVMLYCGERLCGDQKDISMRQLEIILEVILDVVSIRTISEWLKNAALEQLCKISSYLRKLIVDSLGLLKESISLVNSIFRVISSTLRFSQKRKVYQPHFTMSLEGIFQLSHVIDKELGHMSSSLTTELGLATLLMSTPPTVRFCMDKAKLAKVVLQAIPFALQSSCENVRVPKESDSGMLKSSGGWAKKESLLEKLLRWINASIILGFIPTRCSGTNVSFQRSVVENLQSLLDSIQKRNNEYDRSMEEDHSSNFALAAMILHLQLLHQANTTNLPSVILALRLLLFPNDIHNTAVQEFLDGSPNSHLLSLCSKIRCPAEVNPAWRWSFHEPWRNKSIEQTSIQMVEEEHACQVLLFALSNSLVGDSSASPVLSEKDFERLFLWERKNVFGGG